MDFELSDELIAVRDVAREFAEKEIAPSAAKDDREKNFRGDLVKKMGELGFYGTMIPDLYGGNGLGFLAMVLITEEIARAHSAMRVAINMQIGPALTIVQFGTEEQRRKFIPPLLSGEKIGCFAITEADAGSDVAGMRMIAKRDGDRYLLNGSKIFITNAPVSQGGLVYAYTDRSQKHRGMSAFYADWDQPGLTRKPIETLGALSSPHDKLDFLTIAHGMLPVANFHRITLSARASTLGGIATDLFRRLEIDHQFEFGWLLHWQVTWLGALEDAINIRRSSSVIITHVQRVAKKASVLDPLWRDVYRRQPVFRHKIDNSCALCASDRVSKHNDGISSSVFNLRKCTNKISRLVEVDVLKLCAKSSCSELGLSQGFGVTRFSGVPENGDTRKFTDNLLQKLQLFSTNFR